jgi:tetratricopeptide (TPR) repeat protein
VDITRSFCPLLRLPLFRFGWLFPLAVIGIVVSWPLLKGQRLLFFFFSGQMISCCLYFVNARYRLPAAVAVCVFAGYAVFWLTENIIKRRFRPVSLAVAAGLAAGVIIHLPLYRPSNTIAIYNLALVCQRQGRVKEAERLFQDVVRMSPNFDDGYYALGYLYWTQGRRDDAVAAYKKALALNPDFAEVRYNLGFIYSEEGKLDEAQNQFERALSIKPDYKEVLQSLEALCPRRNDSGRARNCWRKVLEFDPDNEAAQQHLKSSGPPQ